MKVLFCASECAPFVKVGGLGDVVGALPKALAGLGVEVSVVIPMYDVIVNAKTDDREQKSEMKTEGRSEKSPLRRETFNVRFKDDEEIVTIYESKLPDSEVPIFFLENDKYLSNGGVYLDKSAFAKDVAEIERFAFFSAAVAAFCDFVRPSLIHCHDWHTSLVPYFLKLQNIPSVLTIHNLANQGLITEGRTLGSASLPIFAEAEIVDRVLDWDKIDGTIDLLLQGIVRSDIVTTVSENYAKEILTKDFGEGLDEVLRSRAADLVGIVNGIDTVSYDPRVDPAIANHYDASLFVENKLKNKIALQEELGLSKSPEKMVIGIISRLTYQKGIDLVLNSLNEIMALGCQLVILGTGEGGLEEKLAAENDRLGKMGNFRAVLKFDEAMSRRMLAGCDVLLVPSRFEPCGLTQLMAMRYGTVPVVRGVGGLLDTVKEGETGFVFTDFTPKELSNCLGRAKKAFMNPFSWQKLVTTGMGSDWSWEVSAKKYVDVYRRALEKHEEKLSLGTDFRRAAIYGGSPTQTVSDSEPRHDAALQGDNTETTRQRGGLFRFDKTKELWTIIAPSRKSRPVSADGSRVKPGMTTKPMDPFAPGNEALTPPEVFRIGPGRPDESGWRVRVTPNKFPITDFHEVIIHNPDITKTWDNFMGQEGVEVLQAYKNRFEFYSSLRSDFYPHLYCNYGEAAGASLPHPHSQLVVFNRLPQTVQEEVTQATSHYAAEGACAYCQLLDNESVFSDRLVFEDDFFLVTAPFASAWPYELTVLPKHHSCDFASITSKEMVSLANILKMITGAIKGLPGSDRQVNGTPYNFWIHSIPERGDYGKEGKLGGNGKSYHWHLEFVPRLKVLAGIELGAGVMVDDKATPEEAAAFYRNAMLSSHASNVSSRA